MDWDRVARNYLVVLCTLSPLISSGQNEHGFSIGYDYFLDQTGREYRHYGKVFDSKGITLGGFKRFREDNGSIKLSGFISGERHNSLLNIGAYGDGYYSSTSTVSALRGAIEMNFEAHVGRISMGIGVNICVNLYAHSNSSLNTDWGVSEQNLNFNESSIGKYKRFRPYSSIPLGIEYRLVSNEQITISINPMYYFPISREQFKLGATSYYGTRPHIKQKRFRLSLIIIFGSE